MTVSASWIGSSGWGTAASARDQVASQASCGRPVSTTTGGHWKISSLSCLAMPMPPAGTASPSRIARAMPPASMFWMTTGSVATSTYSSSGRSGCGRRPSARMTCWRVLTSSL